MLDLDNISEELFNKIRGRFKEVTIGDQKGTVTNNPKDARYFDFKYDKDSNISVSLSEKDGVVVMYNSEIFTKEQGIQKSNWYDFLKELRSFARKRLLNFDTRDITKSNLNKRDYNYLAKNSGDDNMTESKLYGTGKISYQNVDKARIVIKHTESINQERAGGRTQKIGTIHIESAEGERFKYPYKHLNGARAMARHVAEGGNAYDDFGKHIISMSEELSKLKKFKSHMSRNGVMAEGLAEYNDAVNDRINTVKRTVETLQRKNIYAEAVANFESTIFEDVPEDVSSNWIDQLTIRQFNEELSDVFPYIYKLVNEYTKAKELGPDDLMDEGEQHGNSKIYDKCRPGYKKVPGKKRGEKGSCTAEEIELEQGFEEMMGQFAEAKEATKVCKDCGDEMHKPTTDCKHDCDDENGSHWVDANDNGIGDLDEIEDEVSEAYINTSKDAIDVLGALRGKGKKIERGQDDDQGNLANSYANDVWDVYSFIEARTQGFKDLDKNAKKAIDAMMELRGEAKKLETKPGSGSDGKFGNKIVNTLYPVIEYLYTTDFDRNKKEGGDTMDDKLSPDGKKDTHAALNDQKTPLGEFILSYFDKETGEFPKGETAILTMVEKDYGEKYIGPAKSFIEKIRATVEAHTMRTQPQQMETPDTSEYDRIRELAGLR